MKKRLAFLLLMLFLLAVCAASAEHLRDPEGLYDPDLTNVITMYLTVSQGNPADGTDHTWEEINRYSAYDYAELGIDRYAAEGLLSIDTGDGLVPGAFGYGERVPNVTVQIRGQTSTRYDKKSYKLRIKDGKGDFRGQRTLILNKHYMDPYRFVNKLCFDLINEVPELIGSRTQFVHLFVCDESEGEYGEYEDYGLYTMVEQVNKAYLRTHGLDELGQLYKVTLFAWLAQDEIMAPDEAFDREAFERLLEIKGDGDRTLLQTVIRKLGNYSIPIGDIIETHFDAENLCYWLAFNMLIGNYNAGPRNLYLYSPLNSERFYILPWDMDDAFSALYFEHENYSEGQPWERGLTQYVSLILFSRMMKEEGYRTQLCAAVEDLRSRVLSRENVSAVAKRYAEVTRAYLYEGADAEDAVLNDADFDTLVERFGEQADAYYRSFRNSLEMPWPFYVNTPVREGNGFLLSWGNAYEPHGESVTYSFKLAKNELFEDPVASGEGISVPMVTIDRLKPGTYFLRVEAENESGYSVQCFDYYVNSKLISGKVYGCYCFTVTPGGTISPYIAEAL